MRYVEQALLTESGCSLPENSLHLWQISLGSGDVPASWQKLLSDKEQEKASGFVVLSAAQSYMRTRVLLRMVLSKYLLVLPESITIETEAKGKPCLSANSQAWLRFNVSHTDGLLLVGCARTKAVGVDCEQTSRQANYTSIAKKQFTDQEYGWIIDAVPEEQASRFWRLWVAKEACLKLGGMGLTKGLDAFQFEADSNGSLLLSQDPDSEVATFVAISCMPEGYQAAVASGGSIKAIAYQSLSDAALAESCHKYENP